MQAMSGAWGTNTVKSVVNAVVCADQHSQHTTLENAISQNQRFAEVRTGRRLSFLNATVDDGSKPPKEVGLKEPIGTKPIHAFYSLEQPIDLAQTLAGLRAWTHRQHVTEVVKVATEVLHQATGDQPRPDAAETSKFRTLANQANSCLQDLLQAAGRPGAQHCQQASPGSRSHDLKLLGSDLDQVITDRNRSAHFPSRAALALAVPEVRRHCLTPAVRAAKPREVWVLENYEAIMRTFEPMQSACLGVTSHSSVQCHCISLKQVW